MLDQIEEMIEYLENNISLMDLDQLISCVKTIKYAKRSVAHLRGTQYGRALSRSITPQEYAELRKQGSNGHRSGAKNSLAGDESDSEFTSDLLSDFDDDNES